MPEKRDDPPTRRKRQGRIEPIEVVCPRCRATAIVYIPREPIPRCPECGREMIFRELLDEGKSY
jgi:ribosomal protein S27E